MKRVLILAANPKNTERLRLDEEVRDIREALWRSRFRDEFHVRSQLAVRHRDVAREILDYEPHVIHFSGHGTGEDGIALEDETGQAKLVSSEALSGLFQLFSDHVECIILNACYSKEQARVIRQHINYVIGMNTAIKDRAAIEFAVGFYDALGGGKDYDFAYRLGCQYIPMAGINQVDVPELLKKPSLLGSTIRLGVNGSGKKEYEITPDETIDWTRFYDFDAQPRTLANPDTWQQTLLPDLERTLNNLSEGRQSLTLDLRGLIPLAGAFAIGTVFQETRGYTLQVEQWTGQSSLWRSDAQASNLKFRVDKEQGEVGENLCIAFCITRKSWPSVETFYQHSDYELDAIIYLEPDTEVGACDRALTSDADAVALVKNAKELIDYYRQKYQANRLHLLFICPMGFAALLGHRLRAVGEVVAYEYTKSMEKPYVPSVVLNL